MGQLSAACSHSHFVRLFQKQLLQVMAPQETNLQWTVGIGGSQVMAGTAGRGKQRQVLGWSLNRSSAPWVVVET